MNDITNIEPSRNKKVRLFFKRLVLSLGSNMKPSDLAQIKHSLRRLSNKTEWNIWNRAFDIDFPLEVTRVVVEEVGLGVSSSLASLLYFSDFEHDKEFDNNELIHFDEVSIRILESLRKIRSLHFMDQNLKDENVRHLLLALAKDPRVVLIVLAEHIVLLRQLTTLTSVESLRIQNENTFLYVPLAQHLGLYNLKVEMEDISLRLADQATYSVINEKLQASTSERDAFIESFLTPIRAELIQRKVAFQIKWRTKSVNSIYQKMKKQQVSFEEVYDIFAIRIIIQSNPQEEKADCWRVYSIVADIYNPNPGRLRDWLTMPKSNGYESLQTTVMGPAGKWVEIQIRSQRMDEVAEKGIAAHWRYKGNTKEAGLDQWLQRVKEMMENGEISSREIFSDIQTDASVSEVFVFTPKGQLKKLPAGATVLDFAFEIHTDVGAKCVSAKVNHKLVPLKQKLQNGDQVEIITSKNQKPTKDWLRLVVTTRARNKIRKLLDEEKYKHAEVGKEEFHRKLRNWKIVIHDELVIKLLKHFKLKYANDFYSLVAAGSIDMQGLKAVLQSFTAENSKPQEPDRQKTNRAEIKPTADVLIINQELKNVNYRFGKCCHPIFGDEVFGFVGVGKGITIHRNTCPNALSMMSRFPYRIIPAIWNENLSSSSFQATLRISGFDEVGIVNSISNIISNEMKLNMRSISLETKSGIFTGTIKVLVENTGQLTALLHRMQKVKGIDKATRID